MEDRNLILSEPEAREDIKLVTGLIEVGSYLPHVSAALHCPPYLNNFLGLRGRNPPKRTKWKLKYNLHT
jgi:hypothetical protein